MYNILLYFIRCLLSKSYKLLNLLNLLFDVHININWIYIHSKDR